MKIQKGVLTDAEKEAAARHAEEHRSAPAAASPHVSAPAEVEKNRLFETLEKEKAGSRNYARLFIVAVVIVLIAGGVVFYLMLPGVGDTVRAPKGLEQAVRDHLLEKQKRESTDIVFFYCGDKSYWARAGVQTRSDIPNPVYKLDKYAVTAKGEAPNWDISSKPIASEADNKPCS